MAGRPVGRNDNPCNKRKQRNETAEQVNARIEKTAATRKANNAKKAAEAAKNFFQPRRTKSKICTNPGDDVSSGDEDNNGKDDEFITINNDTIEIVPALNVMANLDIDEDEDEPEGNDTDNSFLPDDEDLGVQQEYVKAIQLRLRDEVSIKGSCTDLWLLEHLKANNWWIRKDKALSFAKKLGLKRSYAAYYRDVYVWLPDVRWKDVNCICRAVQLASQMKMLVTKGFMISILGDLLLV